MTAEAIAREHYDHRKGLSESLGRLVQRMWSSIDPADLDGSWAQAVPSLAVGLAGAQLAAARKANGYVSAMLAEQDVDPDGEDVAPAAFAGVASDGRSLDGLLQNPITVVKTGIASGVDAAQAMASGYANLDMLVRTQLADAGRTADQVALVGRPAAKGYVRMLVGKSCSRCVILAGRRYRWNAGFDRHPRCDCIHVPAAEGNVDELRTNPRAYFDSLSRAEQDKTFTIAGAQAARDGADLSQIVNARRGAAGLAPAGGRITAAEAQLLRSGRLQTTNVFGQDLFVTTEGTTVRGFAGQRLGARENGVRLPGARYRSARPPRLMPESIYKIAGNDREEALRLLRRNGYLIEAPKPRIIRPVKALPAKAPVPAPKPVVPAKAVPAPARKAAAAVNALGERVKAGIVRREVLSGGANAKTELLTLADGSKVVFKKARAIEGVTARMQQDAEELVPAVLRAAGLRAPDIYRPTANQLYMEHFDGTVASKHRARGSFEIDPAFYDADQGLLLGLVDQLTDNYDRNGGNWLLGKGGEVLPIDHGFAFSYYGSSTPESVRVAVDQPAAAFHGSRVPHIGSWVDNDMSPADLRELRSRLVALRPEFERLGRGDWHDKMLIRLGKVEQYAKGTKRRIR
jgi:hypothetical protein